MSVLRVKWAETQADSDAVIKADRVGEPKIVGLCDHAWIEGTVKIEEDIAEVVREQHEQDVAWKAYEALPWGDRSRAEQPKRPRRVLACASAPLPGERFCKAHGPKWGEPDLKKQAKARAQMKKLTADSADFAIEADGTEVYTW